MRLPPSAHIDPRKLTEYLLRPRPADDKSAFLALAGYTLPNAPRLLGDIRGQILTNVTTFVTLFPDKS